MKRVAKPVFFIVALLIIALSCMAFFGVHGRNGDIPVTYIKGLNDIRWGIDIKGGVEATFSPADGVQATREDMESAKAIIELRMVNNNITDYELYADYDNGKVIVRFPWKEDETDFDPEAAVEELSATALLTFREGGEYETTEVGSDGQPIYKTPAGTTAENVIMDGKDVVSAKAGMIQDDNGGFTTFIDIQGVEDFHGEMDFKVAGTKKGITAIQMDLKNDGLTMEIIRNALDITYDARCQILDQIMLPCIAEPRPEVSKYAPKMITMHIDPDRIREVIGKGGSVIQKIVAESGAKIDIDDDGTIHIASPDAESCAIAKKCIDDIVFVPEVGKLYYGRVVRLMTFGAFVEIAPGKDGLVHISKLADKRIEKVEDACKVGDMMWVKFMEIDEKGRWNLSHKDAMKEIRAKEAAGEKIQ